MTLPQIKTLVANNLADDKLYSIQVLLTEFIERSVHPDPVPRYRIKLDGPTPVEVISLDDLILKMDSSIIKTSVPFGITSISQAKMLTTLVTYEDIHVTLDPIYESDKVLCMKYSEGKFKLGFILAYMEDGDPVLPLKIININLTPA